MKCLFLFSALNLEVIHVDSKPVTEVLILFSAQFRVDICYFTLVSCELWLRLIE